MKKQSDNYGHPHQNPDTKNQAGVQGSHPGPVGRDKSHHSIKPKQVSSYKEPRVAKIEEGLPSLSKLENMKTKGASYHKVGGPGSIEHKVGGPQSHTRHGKGSHPDDFEAKRKDKHLDKAQGGPVLLDMDADGDGPKD